jgi:hypothetical protein
VTTERAEPPVLAPRTGEHFPPVRPPCQVWNRPGLGRAFETLRGREDDPTRKRGGGLSAPEAQTRRFPRSEAQVPNELPPLGIGSFGRRTKQALLLDLRSGEPALRAIPCLDTPLLRKLVAREDAAVRHRLFPAPTTHRKLTPDALFAPQSGPGLDPEAWVPRRAEPTAAVGDPEPKLKSVREALEFRATGPWPAIERVPVPSSEDGRDGFPRAGRLRPRVARPHGLGHPASTRDAAIQALANRS